MKNWSTGCWLRRRSASGWPGNGSTRPAMPTRTAIRETASGRCGPGAIGWSRPSIAICRTISSRVWQLAGDLLPDATFEQRLATGFCRNHMINGEGGRIAEENRVDYAMDMAETTATVWLGPDDELLPLPRSQIRSPDPSGVLPAARLFQSDADRRRQRQSADSARARTSTEERKTLDRGSEKTSWRNSNNRWPPAPRSCLPGKRTGNNSSLPPTRAPKLADSDSDDRRSRSSDRSPCSRTTRFWPAGTIQPTTPTPSRPQPSPGRLTGIRLEALRDAGMTSGGLCPF